MDLQQIKYVVALAKELNFNRAALNVGVSQPTLSQQLKKLEKELGTPLFERSAHVVRLTSAGERFLPHAIASLDSIEQACEEVRDSYDQLVGKIRLGFIPTVGPYLLPSVIRGLQQSASQIQLELYEETTSSLLDKLKTGDFDLGLLALPIEDASIVEKSLGKEEFFLAVAKNHPLTSRKFVSVKDLDSLSLLVLKEGHCFRDQALDFCKQNQRDAKVVFEGSSLVSVMNLVAASDNATFVPQIAVKKSAHSGLRFLPFRSPKPMREIGVIWRMTTPLNRVQKFLIEKIEEQIRLLKNV